jgi:hypothetical protein
VTETVPHSNGPDPNRPKSFDRTLAKMDSHEHLAVRSEALVGEAQRMFRELYLAAIGVYPDDRHELRQLLEDPTTNVKLEHLIATYRRRYVLEDRAPLREDFSWDYDGSWKPTIPQQYRPNYRG